MLFFSSFLGSSGGWPARSEAAGAASWRAARAAQPMAADLAVAVRARNPRRASSPGAGGGGATFPARHIRHRCGRRRAAGRRRPAASRKCKLPRACVGQIGVAGIPDCGSISTDTIPSGAMKSFVSPILAHAARLLHELRPDRRGRVRAFQVQLAIVVEADPDHAQQLGGKPANQPSCDVPVLPGCREVQAVARAHTRCRPVRSTSSIRFVIRYATRGSSVCLFSFLFL